MTSGLPWQCLAWCLVSDHLWMPFKTKPAPLWSPPSFWRQKPEPAPIKSRPQGQQRWKVEWINNLVGEIYLQLYCDNLVNMKAWWRLQATFRADLTAIAMRDGTLKDCQGDNLTVTQRHVWLIGWVIDHQPPLRSTKGEKELAAHWLSVDSRLSLVFCFSFDSCSSVFLLSQLRITECGCAQSCSPLQAAAVIPWWTLDNVSNKQCELLYRDQQRTISTTETTHSLLRISNLTNTCNAAMLSMRF